MTGYRRPAPPCTGRQAPQAPARQRPRQAPPLTDSEANEIAWRSVGMRHHDLADSCTLPCLKQLGVERARDVRCRHGYGGVLEILGPSDLVGGKRNLDAGR